jgi:hypothetical protein
LGIGDWGLGIGDWGLGIGDKKNDSGKVMKIININKMNNFILNSKTNYANYKKVPHQKNEHNKIS